MWKPWKPFFKKRTPGPKMAVFLKYSNLIYFMSAWSVFGMSVYYYWKRNYEHYTGPINGE